MLISVVIPTYHRNDLLARCLRQLAPGVQTLWANQYEVIVTDDGRDTTAEAMITSDFPWVRWIEGPKRGPAANRNHGVMQSANEWIAFTDDDCVPSSTWLENFANSISQGTCVYEGKTTCEANICGFAEEAPVNLCGGKLFSCNFMISRELFITMGGFDENFPDAQMEDTDMLERIRMDQRHVRFVPFAVIDHPPRPRVRGLAAGKRWASKIYFDQKWRRIDELRRSLPLFVLKVRIWELLNYYKPRDWPAAFWSLCLEASYAATHVYAWRRQSVASVDGNLVHKGHKG